MNRRTLHRPPPPEPHREPVAAATAGPPRSVAGLAVVTLTAALLLVWAAAAQASVWVIPAMARAYPDDRSRRRAPDASPSTPRGTSTRACRCACAAASARSASRWGTGQRPARSPRNAQLFRVYYVKVTTPTTKLGSRAGWYPDPLVPRELRRGDDRPRLGTTPDRRRPSTSSSMCRWARRPARTRRRSRRERRAARSMDIPFIAARLGLRLDADQHPFRLRRQPGRPSRRSLPRNRPLQRRVQGRGCCATSTRHDEAARHLSDRRALPAAGRRTPATWPSGDWASPGGAVPRRERRRRGPPGQPAAIPALVPLEPQSRRPSTSAHPDLPQADDAPSTRRTAGTRSPTSTSSTRRRKPPRSGRPSGTPGCCTRPTTPPAHGCKSSCSPTTRGRTPRRRQDGQHVPLRRRRHLGAALLLLLRAHPGGARAPERRQGDLVVHRTPTTP